MKLKDYSLRIKKNLAVILHIVFLTIALGGISFIYLNGQIGSGFSWLLDRQYDDSPQFQQQFQADVDHILNYVSYRDVFESEGSLDLSTPVFSVTRGEGPEIIYTLDEVLRYAKSQGFYLNDQFEVVNDLFLYDNVSTTQDQRVNWRAYNPNKTLSEPGDAYTSLLDLSKEVLDCLSEYYTVYYHMLAYPSNLSFQIVYRNEDEEQVTYSNAENQTPEQLKQLGRYCYLDSSSVIIETNLKEIPKNLASSMENNNIYNAESYYMVIAVDTDYPADDAYAQQAADYHHLRTRFLEGLLGMILGIMGCLVTLYYLIIVSGYRTEERENPYLHNFDTITTESCILFTGLGVMFALFLGESILYKLIHLLTPESTWQFAERMSRAVIIYTCCMIGAFSLLRRYKSRQLWENSLLHHILIDIDSYFAERTFCRQLLYSYLAFLAAQIVGFSFLGIGLHFHAHLYGKLLFFITICVLIAIDYKVFFKLFNNYRQEDQIADAISRIAGGDTGYQMDLQGLTGKELQIGHRINSIGIGLEQALQEQVKSERLKADLITNVSHDIKTPLTSIINYVDLLKRENLPGEKAQEYLRVLDQKSQRLKNLTEDLVEASKASSGNIQLELSSLDLVEMIWQTNGEFEEKFATRNLELISHLPDQSILIEADGRRLWRILENVYNNAFKYAMENSRVYTDVETKDDHVYFTIKNVSASPLNIGADELSERFVRGDVSRTTEGSGLGLSIAESLTRLQGGSFEILIDGDLFKIRVGFPILSPASNT